MQNKKYTCYRLLNLTNNKSYIGSTQNIEQRICNHKNGKYEWQKDFKENNENWKVIILCDNIDIDDIANVELNYIKLYDSVNNGYNKTYNTTRKLLAVTAKQILKKINKEQRYSKEKSYEEWKYWYDKWEEKKRNMTPEERTEYEWEMKFIRLLD